MDAPLKIKAFLIFPPIRNVGSANLINRPNDAYQSPNSALPGIPNGLMEMRGPPILGRLGRMFCPSLQNRILQW